MAEEDKSTEKTEDPSAHRLEEFRKKGDVASSKELSSILILMACSLTLMLSMVYIYESLSGFVEWLYMQDYDKIFIEENQKKLFSKIMNLCFKTVGPIFLVTFCTAIIVNIAQIGFLFSPEVLNLNFNRVNPVQGAKKLFTMKSLVEAVKGIFKFAIIITIVYLFMKRDMQSYIGFLHLDFFQSFVMAKSMISELVIFILIGLFVVAIGDFAYQKLTYRKKIMMTKQELKEETKEQEGSPELKQRIRSIQREMSQKRMMNDVPKADVIVTNPTHFSVALKYDSENMSSPQVLAKGKDHIALKIREIAKDNNVPIVENIPLARALYKTVNIGESIPRSLYKAVAEILAFVYKMKNKKRITRKPGNRL